MVSADASARPSAPGDPETLRDVWAVEVVDADDTQAELETAFRILISDGRCVSEQNPQASKLGRVLAGRPTDAKRSKRTAHGNTLLCGGMILPYPL